MALKGALNFTQVRALLWKDVLVRARQPVSIFYLDPLSLVFLSLSLFNNMCDRVLYNIVKLPKSHYYLHKCEYKVIRNDRGNVITNGLMALYLPTYLPSSRSD